MNKIELITKHGLPVGIRDESGFIVLFPKITEFHGQKERYYLEVQKQFLLANTILKALKAKRTVFQWLKVLLKGGKKCGQ